MSVCHREMCGGDTTLAIGRCGSSIGLFRGGDLAVSGKGECRMTVVERTQHEPADQVLIEVKHLKMYFPLTSGVLVQRTVGYIKAVDDVSFVVRRGETLGLVGESGCGKTTTGRCILRLERPTAGEILYDGVDIARLEPKDLLALRRRIQVIFQDPCSSLNPRMKV